MTAYTVVVCTKPKRSVTNLMPKLQWRGVEVNAQNPGAAIDQAYRPYETDAKVRAYVHIYTRDTHGIIGFLTARGDHELGGELRALLDGTHAHYQPDFPWHQDDFDPDKCAGIYARLTS
jgi:hypothetical protein